MGADNDQPSTSHVSSPTGKILPTVTFLIDIPVQALCNSDSDSGRSSSGELVNDLELPRTEHRSCEGLSFDDQPSEEGAGDVHCSPFRGHVQSVPLLNAALEFVGAECRCFYIAQDCKHIPGIHPEGYGLDTSCPKQNPCTLSSSPVLSAIDCTFISRGGSSLGRDFQLTWRPCVKNSEPSTLSVFRAAEVRGVRRKPQVEVYHRCIGVNLLQMGSGVGYEKSQAER